MNNLLWEHLQKAELVEGQLSTSDSIESPWYVKILLAVSGWLAAIFLLCFIGFVAYNILGDLLNEIFLIPIGGVLVFLSFVFLHSKKDNEFVEHLAFAFSIAGQIFFVIGLFELLGFSGDAEFFLIIGLVKIPLFLFMPNATHRLVSAFIAGICFAAYIYSHRELVDGLLLYTAVLMLIASYLWLNEFKSQKTMDALRAIAYGLVLALIVITGTKLFMHTSIWEIRVGNPESTLIRPWMGELLLSAVSLYIVQTLLNRQGIRFLSSTWVLSIIATVLLTFLSLQAHGVIVGVMILTLGFSASNRILMGLGIISLLFYSSSYYYLLSTTLLDKSITLFILGIILLLSRWIMLKLLSSKNTEVIDHLPTFSTKDESNEMNKTSINEASENKQISTTSGEIS